MLFRSDRPSLPTPSPSHWTLPTLGAHPLRPSAPEANMSTSVGVNVLRWSALGLGVFYGIYHQASISAKDKLEAAKREYQHKEALIQQARAEWAKTHSPSASSPTQTSAAKADPKDPNADLNTLLGITDEK